MQEILHPAFSSVLSNINDKKILHVFHVGMFATWLTSVSLDPIFEYFNVRLQVVEGICGR